MAGPEIIRRSRTLPVIGASMVVWRGPRVLLIRRAREPFKDAWSVPGGTVEPGEAVEAAALREVMEETGIIARSLGLAGYLDVIERRPDATLSHHFVLMVFSGIHQSGSLSGKVGEVNEVDWIDPAHLDRLSTTPQLADAIALSRDAVQRGDTASAGEV